MKSRETTAETFATTTDTDTQKFKRFLSHPFTLIVLVWIFLFAAFYFVSEWI